MQIFNSVYEQLEFIQSQHDLEFSWSDDAGVSKIIALTELELTE